MYWIGTSKWPIRRWIWRIPREIIQGVKDNIPICCTLWYTIVKVLCMFTTASIRSILREKIGYGFAIDFYIFVRLMPGRFDKKNRRFSSKDFQELQYWRCPICRATKRKEKLRWDTGTYWEFHI